MTKNGGRIWAHDWENSGGPAGRKELADRCSLTMSLSGASASAAAKQRHQEQRRADTSALADAARGQRQMPQLPPYVPEFDLAFMPQMLGVGAVRSEPEDPATGDDETIMQEAAVDVALQLLTDGEGLHRRCSHLMNRAQIGLRWRVPTTRLQTRVRGWISFTNWSGRAREERRRAAWARRRRRPL